VDGPLSEFVTVTTIGFIRVLAIGLSVIYVLAYILLNTIRLERHMYAIGNNSVVAELAGLGSLIKFVESKSTRRASQKQELR
jgi:ribose/xylose/arabinose/galactoside ABC-type transport system permease subunit